MSRPAQPTWPPRVHGYHPAWQTGRRAWKRTYLVVMGHPDAPHIHLWHINARVAQVQCVYVPGHQATYPDAAQCL